ncbi:hypothetical protein GCM10011576_50910 [Micromonospora parathelypteridis]|nr:hypothetical protein GCM10011576_50910 [Micromonospora parathelypteridis]
MEAAAARADPASTDVTNLRRETAMTTTPSGRKALTAIVAAVIAGPQEFD